MKTYLAAITLLATSLTSQAIITNINWSDDSPSAIKVNFSGVDASPTSFDFSSPSGLWNLIGSIYVIPYPSDHFPMPNQANAIIMGFRYVLTFDGSPFGFTNPFDEIRDRDEPQLIVFENTFNFAPEGWNFNNSAINFFEITSRIGDISTWEWAAMSSASGPALPVRNVPETSSTLWCLILSLVCIIGVRRLSYE